MRRSTVSICAVLAIVLLLGISSAAFAAGSALFSTTDPAGDDRGPGTYVYPTNGVFKPGAFDITKFEVVDLGAELGFRISLASEVANPWAGPNGISVQMFQIYIDKDHTAGSGFTEAIPGANVAFAKASAWEQAIIAEGGWGTEVEDLVKDSVFEDMAAKIYVSHTVSAEGNVVTVRVPKKVVGAPEPGWGYQVLALGQEGSKDSMDGVKVRRVLKANTEWQFGGSDESGLHPNAIDILVPAGQDQYKILGSYNVKLGELAVIPMLYAK